MPNLPEIPVGTDVFVDANILIYALNGKSPICRAFLERCSREELIGICSFTVVNEATHRLMLAEAKAKGLISKETAKELCAKPNVVQSLVDYWNETERILALNLLFVQIGEQSIRVAESERKAAGLCTNDSLIVASMRELGLSHLATNDAAFERVNGIEVFRPGDIR